MTPKMIDFENERQQRQEKKDERAAERSRKRRISESGPRKRQKGRTNETF